MGRVCTSLANRKFISSTRGCIIMPTIRIKDINMYYEIHGEGEPIVLIAGLGTDLASHAEMIGWLSKKYRVLAFDNRGEGLTDKPKVRYSIEMMADDTAGLIDALGIAKANVIGISMGGRIAMALALQHPELVRTLILTSTFARRTRNARLPVRHRIKKLTGVGGSTKSKQPYHAFARQFKAARSYDCSDRLDEIRVPTLILHGRKDNAVPYEMAEEMQAGIKGSKLIAFDGGHRFIYWESKRFSDVVEEFLKEIE
jgi:3-oxoadipate enol-lactonase